MRSEKVLEIVLREMTAYGSGWRASWYGFDGRSLRSQLDGIADWARKALAEKIDSDYIEGTEFYKDRTS